MVDIWTIIISVIIGDSIVMGIFVLILNPRLSGATAAKKIKSELLGDREFIRSMLKDLISFDDILDNLFERLRRKIQGTILSDAGTDQLVDRMISKSVAEAHPEMGIIVDLITSRYPKYGKLLNPTAVNNS